MMPVKIAYKELPDWFNWDAMAVGYRCEYAPVQNVFFVWRSRTTNIEEY